jgi:cytochrome c peroxidase
MLRNVAKTAPYFHDGSVEKLEDAVRIMASLQLARVMPDEEIRSITAFLESLSGSIPKHYNGNVSRPQ